MSADLTMPLHRKATAVSGDRGASTTAARADFSQAGPWLRSDAVAPGIVVVLGLIGAVLSWNGASRKANYEDQTGWIFAGVFSAVLLCLGIAMWLITGLRAVRGGQRELWTKARAVWDLPAGAPPRSQPESGADGVDLVIGDRMTMYHRADCLITRRKEVHPVSATEVAGLEACGICRP